MALNISCFYCTIYCTGGVAVFTVYYSSLRNDLRKYCDDANNDFGTMIPPASTSPNMKKPWDG